MSFTVCPPEIESQEGCTPRNTFERENGRGWFAVVAAAAVFFVCLAGAFSFVAPEAYMDEVFHVPQARAYCEGDYGRWDPKITTPPGLYAAAVGYARLAGIGRRVVLGHHGPSQVCTTVMLRHVNWAFSVGTLVLLRKIFLRRMSPSKATVHATFLWLYPVSFFFSFLFYTDAGATFFFFLCYILATGPPGGGSWHRRCGSALAGAVAILFRQTNAVWIAFTLAACLLEDFSPVVMDRAGAGAGLQGDGTRTADRVGPEEHPSRSSRPSNSRRRRTDQGNGVLKVDAAMPGSSQSGDGMRRQISGDQSDASAAHLGRAEREAACAIGARFPLLPILLLRLAIAACADARRGGPMLRLRLPLAIPIAAFAIFVWGFNGGSIVLGDKENHSPTGPPHLAQIAYLSAVGASLWGAVGRESVFGRQARRGFKRWTKEIGPLGCAALVSVSALALWRHSLAHPFLVADNRHYTFYVWQRLLRFPFVRSALSPAYVFCAWLMASRLRERKPSLWVLAFAASAAAVLVPSPLLEPRYFTIPVLLSHVESPERSWKSLRAGVAACIVVNSVIVYVFLCRPFAWHDGSVARFMW